MFELLNVFLWWITYKLHTGKLLIITIYFDILAILNLKFSNYLRIISKYSTVLIIIPHEFDIKRFIIALIIFNK